jgi:hypothetical protein
VNKYTLLKMKVSIAAKTIGSALAAAIETLVDCGKNIPTEAIETACFIQKDVNNLFESFNSTGIPISKYNPRYTCALAKNSFHLQFWESMKEKMTQPVKQSQLCLCTIPPPHGGTAILPEYIHYYG